MRTLHGIHVHGFPNLFLVQPTQGANLLSNVPHTIVDSAATITAVVGHALAKGFGSVEPTRNAEDAWVELLLSGPGGTLGEPDGTPGYSSNEGQDPGQFLVWLVAVTLGGLGRNRRGRGYPYGASAYFRYIDGWRASGRFEGLEFSAQEGHGARRGWSPLVRPQPSC
jgi:cyclohexanone monooxygenase